MRHPATVICACGSLAPLVGCALTSTLSLASEGLATDNKTRNKGREQNTARIAETLTAATEDQNLHWLVATQGRIRQRSRDADPGAHVSRSTNGMLAVEETSETIALCPLELSS